MDFAPHSLTERAVNELMPGKCALAGELLRHDDGLIVALSVGTHLDAGSVEATLYQFDNLSRIHLVSSRNAVSSLAEWRLEALTGSLTSY